MTKKDFIVPSQKTRFKSVSMSGNSYKYYALTTKVKRSAPYMLGVSVAVAIAAFLVCYPKPFPYLALNTARDKVRAEFGMAAVLNTAADTQESARVVHYQTRLNELSDTSNDETSFDSVTDYLAAAAEPMISPVGLGCDARYVANDATIIDTPPHLSSAWPQAEFPEGFHVRLICKIGRPSPALK